MRSLILCAALLLTAGFSVEAVKKEGVAARQLGRRSLASGRADAANYVPAEGDDGAR
jgi:hypothetical protein